MGSELGCTNHGCPFVKPGGMKTNGPCKCVQNIIRDSNYSIAASIINREIKNRNNRIEQLEAARLRLGVLAIKHCPKEHHDWEEIMQLTAFLEQEPGNDR